MKNPQLSVALAALLGYARAYDRQPPFPHCYVEDPENPEGPPIKKYNIGGICCESSEFNFLDTACVTSCPYGWLAQGQICVLTCNAANGFSYNGSGECVCSGSTPQNTGGICCADGQYSEWRYDPTEAGQYSIQQFCVSSCTDEESKIDIDYLGRFDDTYPATY